MTKEAIAARSLIKALGIGTGAAALGVGSGVMGYRTGAKRTANAMASAFSDANARENQAMINAFNLANKRENAMLANTYLRKGYQLGVQHATTSGSTGQMNKTSEANMAALLLDAMEKDAAVPAALMGLLTRAKPAVGGLMKSFKHLGAHAAQAGKYVGQGAKAGNLRGVGTGVMHHARQAVTGAGKPAAMALGGAGLFAAGRRSKRQKAVTYYK